MPDVRVDDFSGGKTDLWIGGDPRFAKDMDNLLIDRQGKPYQRPGSALITNIEQVPSGVVRITAMFFWDFGPSERYLFVVAGTKLYYSLCTIAADGSYTYGAWAEITGPAITGSALTVSAGTPTAQSINALASTLAPFGAALTTNSRVYPMEMPNHIYFTGWPNAVNADINSTLLVSKLYKSYGGAFQLRTAGLPPIPGQPFPMVGSGSPTYNYLYAFCFKYTYRTWDGTTYTDRGPVTLFQFSNGTAIGNTAPTRNIFDVKDAYFNATTSTQWDIDNIKLEIYRSVNGGSIPMKICEVPMGNFGITFKDGYLDTDLQGTTSPSAFLNNYNPSTDSEWGTQVYTVGGYSQTSMPGFVRYAATANEAAWYAGTIDNVYSTTDDAGPRYVFQSVPGDGDGVPEDFLNLMDSVVTGIGALDTMPIVFGETRCDRLEGIADAQGRGGAIKRPISTEIGCIHHGSIVSTGKLIYFASKRGICYTDGYDVKPLMIHLQDSWKGWTETQKQKVSITGKLNKTENRIYWSIKSNSTVNSNLSDCDMFLVLDLEKPLSEKSCFTTMSGGVEPLAFAPTAFDFDHKGRLVRGDARGYTFLHQNRLLCDPVVDTAVSTGSWYQVAVVYSLITCAFNFGTERMKKWITRILSVFQADTIYQSYDYSTATISGTTVSLTDPSTYDWPGDLSGMWIFFSGDNYATAYKITSQASVYSPASDTLVVVDDAVSPLSGLTGAQNWVIRNTSGKVSVQVSTSRDASGAWKNLKAIRKRVTVAVEQVVERMLPKRGLRCTFRQFAYTNAYVDLAKSDSYATASCSGSTTLLTSGSWPTDVKGQWIHFETSPGVYETTGRKITAISGNTLTLASAATAAARKWVIMGYPRDEKFKLQSYTIPYDIIGQSVTPYAQADDGGNA